MKVKVLTGEAADNYLKNSSKLDNIAAMETQLAEASTTITDLTNAAEQLSISNTALEAQVADLTSQVAALKGGAGAKQTKVPSAAGGGSGDALMDSINTARSLINGLGKK